MIEIAIREYLDEKLNVPVLMEQPKTPPKEYVLLRLVDSGRKNQIDAATFFVTVISDTLYKAAQLSETIKDELLGSITLDCISSATLGGESATLDASNHVYNYNLTFNFYYYREETQNG